MLSRAFGSCAFSAAIQGLAHALEALPSCISQVATGTCVCMCVYVCMVSVACRIPLHVLRSWRTL